MIDKPHTCTCGGCDVGPFEDTCKYELKALFYEGMLLQMAEHVGGEFANIISRAVAVRVQDLLECKKKGRTPEEAAKELKIL